MCVCCSDRRTVLPTPRAWSDCWRATAPSRRTRRSGWPSRRRTCSAPARRATAKGLDTSGLTGVISVDPDARTADVAGMCTYEDLVAATLPYGLSPLVVPQLKTITLGGAVTGLGIESASFRNGLPHESVLEMDILTGTGEVVTASPRAARRPVPRLPEFLWHAWLFGAAEDRAGTGQAVRRAATPAVPLADRPGRRDGPHHRDRRPSTASRSTTSTAWCSAPTRATCASACRRRRRDPVSDYTGQDIYYRSIQHADGREARPADHPRLPVALGHRLVLVLAGVRRAEPDDPAVLAAAAPAQQLLLEADRLRPAVRHRRPHREAQRQAAAASASCRTSRCRSDAPPSSSTGSSTTCRSSRSGCVRCGCATTARLAAVPDSAAPHLRQRRLLVVGAGRRRTEGQTNRLIERKVSELDGHKSLYSDAYYSPEEFDELYGGETYKTVKKTYDPDSRLLDLYAKAVQRR